VTIAKRPSDGCGTAESIKLFLPNGEAKYFSKEDWTANRESSPSGKSVGLSDQLWRRKISFAACQNEENDPSEDVETVHGRAWVTRDQSRRVRGFAGQ
jgi:hypothetical protein